jgi:uncharacterized repeat protein (TIGR01451 family)
VLTLVALLLFLTAPATAAQMCANAGVDGPGTPSGIVNTYYRGTLNPAAGATSITVGTPVGDLTKGIAVGDLLLVIQMQDADIKSDVDSNLYGGNNGSGSGYTALNQTGLYEFVKATSALTAGSAGSISFQGSGSGGGLAYSYRTRAAGTASGQSTYQVVRVPQYSSAVISSPVAATPWNGTAGGVIAMDVSGTLTVNSSISADGAGFHGGWGESAAVAASPITGYRMQGSAVTGNGMKGEGIAGSPNRMNQNATFNGAPVAATLSASASLGYPNSAALRSTDSKGRGAPGNAGGGGTDGTATNTENSGGGGGGNYSSGGKGGNSWNSDLNIGGEGGSYVAGIAFNRVVMGGGGGAGSTNNATADAATYSAPPGISCSAGAGACSSGAPGGGIILLRANYLSGSGSVSARGGSGYNVLQDAAGGGGAGGTVVLQTKVGGIMPVNASGGDGGNAWRGDAGGTADRHGPGGGGSGGFIAYSPAAGFLLIPNITGGMNGKSTTLNDDYGSSGSSGGIAVFESPSVPGPAAASNCLPNVTIAKSTSTPTIATLPGTATYTISAANSGSATAQQLTISDALPGWPILFSNSSAAPTITYTPNSIPCNSSRSSTSNAAVGTATPQWGQWDLPASCQVDLTFSVTVPSGTVAALYQNAATVSYLDPSRTIAGQKIALSSNPLASTAEDVTVLAPVSVAKSFGAASISAGGTTTVTVTLTNANSTPITAVGFTDTLPSATSGNMTIANPPLPATTCGGAPVLVGTAGAGSFTASGLTIPANGSCTVTFTVTVPAAGIYVNTIAAGAVSGSTGSNSTPASASLTVNMPLVPPTISKSFQTNPILPGGTSKLIITLSNANASTAINSAGFIDTFPTGLTIAAIRNLSNSCGGTVTATAGSNYISLNTNGTIPAGAPGSCQVQVDVTSNQPGIYVNTTGQVVGDTGTGNRASDTLTVMSPITASASFTSVAVPRSTSSVLQITLTNPNSVPVTGVTFTDSYPAGLLNSTSASGATTCPVGAVTATNSGTSLSFSAGTIAANSSCTVTVNVQSATSGVYVNSTGALTTSNAGSGASSSATLYVTQPPVVAKNFNPPSVAPSGGSGMAIVVTNPASNPLTLTGVAISDDYTGTTLINSGSGAVVCTDGSTGTLSGGVSGGKTVGMAGAAILPGGSCIITQMVTATTSTTNTTSAPTSIEGGTGTAAVAYLQVLQPLVVTKSFANPVTATATNDLMTISMFNPNPVSVNNAAFVDTMPANVTYTGAAALVGSCGTPAATTSTGTANVGVKNAIIPAGSTCTLTANVQLATANVTRTNSITVTTDNAGSATASATISNGTATAPPVLSAAFSPTPINTGGSSTLTFTVRNPNAATALAAIAFTDTLPTGLTATNATIAACGGTMVITGGNTLTFSGGSLAAATSCAIPVTTVTSVISGTHRIQTSTVTATPGALVGNYAEASLTVNYRPTISLLFGTQTLAPGGTTTLTVFLGNQNGGTLALTAPLDNILPTSPGAMTLVNGTVTNNTCTGLTPLNTSGTALAAGNTGVRVPSGYTIPAGSCQFSVNVTASSAGTYTDSIAAGALVTAAGSNTDAATTQLVVSNLPPTVSTMFAPAAIASGGVSTMIITLSNPNDVPVSLIANLVDTLPTNLVRAATPNISTTCRRGDSTVVTPTSTAGSLTLPTDTTTTLTRTVIPPGSFASPGTCTVQMDVTSAVTGLYTNTIAAGSLQSSAGNNSLPATAVLTVNAVSPPTVSTAFGTTAIVSGASTTLTVTLSNTNPGAATLSANLDDTFPTLPGAMTLTNSTVVSNSCTGLTLQNLSGGALAAGNSGVRVPSGYTIPAGGCQFTVNVTAATAGAHTNSIAAGALQTNYGSSPGATSDTVNVYAPPTASKSFGAATILTGGSTTLTLTLGNPAGNATAITGVQVDDPFPAGLSLLNTLFTFTPAACGTVTKTTGAASAAGDTAIRFSVATIAAGASCQLVANVTSATLGAITNTTTAPTFSGPLAQTGTAASAPLTVLPLPALAVSKTASQTPLVAGKVGQSYSITIAVTNGPTIQAITIIDPLPTGITTSGVITATGGTLSGCPAAGASNLTGCAIAAGAATGSIVITVPVSVAATATSGTNSATATGGGDPVCTGAPACTASTPIIAILDAVDDLTSKQPGVTASTDVSSNDRFPATSAFSLQPGSNCTTPAVDAAGMATYTAPVVAGNTCTVNYKVCAPAPNSAVCDSATLTVTASAAQLLQITKTADVPTVAPGSLVTYTIGYSNPNAATWFQNVIITDQVPLYTTFTSAACGALPPGITSCVIAAPAVGATGTITWTLGGNLNAGSSGTVTLSIKVD